MKRDKTTTCLLALIIILSTAITAQQYQVYLLNTQIGQLNKLQQWLYKNYGVSSIEELKAKLTQEIEGRYRGNPFVTSLYPGQLQAENITGMHWYTYLSGSLYNRTDVLAYPEQTATFIIFKDSAGNVCAKNTTSGQIQYGGAWGAGGVDGANASAVMQAVIDALTDGGKVFFQQGTFTFSTFISLPQDSGGEYDRPVIISGSGWSTILTRNTDGPIFKLQKGTYRVRNIIFRDLMFKDGGQAGEILFFNGSDRIRIEDVCFRFSTKTAYAIYAEDTWDVVVYGVLFHGGGNESTAMVRLVSTDDATCNNWRFEVCRWERGTIYNSTAIASERGGSKRNHNIHILNSKIHGALDATFKARAVVFNGTQWSSVRDTWICHHFPVDGVIFVDADSSKIELSGLFIASSSAISNPNSFLSIYGDYVSIDKIISEGAPTQIVLLQSTSTGCYVANGTIIDTTGGVTKVTDNGSGNTIENP